MKGANSQIVIVLLITAAMSFVPFVVGHTVLNAHATRMAQSEVEALTKRYLGRAERVLSEAVATLRDVDRAGHRACLDTDRIAFGEAISRSSYVRRVGVVDRNGNIMCMEPASKDTRRAVLPSVEDADKPIIFSLLDPEASQPGSTPTVMVGWRTYEGARLVAQVASAPLEIDPGPAFLLDQRRVKILVDGNKIWLQSGPSEQGTQMAQPQLTAELTSELFPLKAVATVAQKDAVALDAPLEMTLTAASVAVFLVLIVLALWLNRRPERAFDSEFLLAIANEEFIPYYQPVMNIETGQVEGCEMLVRWVRRDGTVVSPGRFMNYAETSGHIFPMTRLLMRKSAKELGPLYKLHPQMKLSINLFAGHFDNRTIIEDIVNIFSDSDVAYDQLVFEVTERYPLKDVEKARKIISEMHALGCRVALDDAGTGHGGLAYIQQLGIDIIKIDKMFIDAMLADLGAARIVDVLIELANSLGMDVVAEGIEHEEQIEKLKEKGVTAAQGYIFAPALPGPLFLDLVKSLSGGEDDEDDETPAAPATKPKAA